MPTPNDSPGPTSRQLLIVDDDAVFAGVLARVIGRRGFDVTVVHDAASALALAASSPIAYAVVDLKLPDSSGLRLIRQLKSMWPAARIVLLTGYGSIATTVDAIKLGAVYYLTKPVNADEVIDALHRDDVSEEPVAATQPLSVNRLEWEHINRILAETNGNVSASARLLGMHRRTLQRKLGKHPVQR
jgi:two-component system response regulator RegA